VVDILHADVLRVPKDGGATELLSPPGNPRTTASPAVPKHHRRVIAKTAPADDPDTMLVQ